MCVYVATDEASAASDGWPAARYRLCMRDHGNFLSEMKVPVWWRESYELQAWSHPPRVLDSTNRALLTATAVQLMLLDDDGVATFIGTSFVPWYAGSTSAVAARAFCGTRAALFPPLCGKELEW